MLHHETVYSRTLELLRELMAIPELESFNLVGGTALALQIGHRISIDLDFFGKVDKDLKYLLPIIEDDFDFEILSQNKNVLVLKIDEVKVDFVNYRYKFIRDIELMENLRLASIEDIAAMKLAAITGRGAKKDFYDLYFLLQIFSLSEILQFFKEKFPDGNEFLVLKSLTYFEDAEGEFDPKMLKTVKWSKVKREIIKATNQLFK